MAKITAKSLETSSIEKGLLLCHDTQPNIHVYIFALTLINLDFFDNINLDFSKPKAPIGSHWIFRIRIKKSDVFYWITCMYVKILDGILGF